MDIRGGRMNNKSKSEILEQEIQAMYRRQGLEERKQKFKTEIEAIEYTKKQDEEIQKYIQKRKKELGIDNSTK